MARTSISSGITIYKALAADEAVKALCSRVYPVYSLDEETLPYIVYERTSAQGDYNKSGQRDLFSFDIAVYAKTYGEAVDIAEAVRAALEDNIFEGDGMVTKYITFRGATETWQDDAYIVNLSFEAKTWWN
jgi:hypothetical protein